MTKKNEQGYALLIVLLLITIITIISAVFIRGSISNAKQEKIIDNGQLKVVAGEAGIDYTKTQFLNKYYEKKSALDIYAKSLIDEQIAANLQRKKNNQIPINYEEVREKTAKALFDHLKDVNVSQIINVPFDKDGNFSYELDYEPIKAENYKTIILTNNDNVAIGLRKDGYTIEVSGALLGKMKGNEKKARLLYEQSFTVPPFDPAKIPAPPQDGTGGLPVDIKNLYPQPEPTNECKFTRGENKRCVSYGNDDIKGIEGYTIYLPKGLNFSHGQKNVSNVTFYVKNTFSIQNFNQNSNVNLFIDGFLDVSNNVKINDSVIVVNGNARINNNLEIKQNSKVCITGSLSAGKIKLSDSGKLYLSDVISNSKYNGANIIKLKTNQEVLQKCLNDETDTSIKSSWLEPVIDVTYK